MTDQRNVVALLLLHALLLPLATHRATVRLKVGRPRGSNRLRRSSTAFRWSAQDGCTPDSCPETLQVGVGEGEGKGEGKTLSRGGGGGGGRCGGCDH